MDFVSEPGQFAVRGAIVDIFSYSYNDPFRISFFGDEIETINIFDCNTQLSKEKVVSAEIYPDLAGGDEESETLVQIADILPPSSLIWLDSSDMYKDQAFYPLLDRFTRIYMELPLSRQGEDAVRFNIALTDNDLGTGKEAKILSDVYSTAAHFDSKIISNRKNIFT